MPNLASDRAFQALTQNGGNLRQSLEIASRIVVAEYIRHEMIPSTTEIPVPALRQALKAWLDVFAQDLEST